MKITGKADWLLKNTGLAVLASLSTSVVCGSVFADQFVNEAFVDSTNVYEATGSMAGEQMGADLATGDFNGDGISDIIASSPFASYGDKKWNGRVTVVLGKRSDINATKSERSNEWANINIYGKSAGDQVGTSLSVGDFDGDGKDDLAIGAHNASYGPSRPGKAYIIYGKSFTNKKTFDFSFTEGDTVLHGMEGKDGFGMSVEAGDVNGDGFDDLLIGAPFAKNENNQTSGLVYVYYGSKKGIDTGLNGVIHGQSEGERFGSEIAIGDLFGDTKKEVAVGAYYSKTGDLEQAGSIYLFSGRDSFGSVKRPTSIIQGDMKLGWLGFTLDLADINADGKDDIATSYFSYSGDTSAAKAFVIYGDEKFSKLLKTFTSNANLVDITVGDQVGEAILGAKVLLKDLNGDGKGEVIVGAPGISGTRSIDMGDVYIVYSGENGFEKRYSVKNKTVTSIVHGQGIDDWFGYSLEAADFNADGIVDLIVGARYADTDKGVNNGKVFVIYGEVDPIGEEMVVNLPYDEISRSEFVRNVVKSFGLADSNKEFLDNCFSHKEYCFFNFMTVSTFEGLTLDPELLLYPDVKPGDSFFDEVNVATALGLINGYTNEDNTPFKPELPISRVQALKIILSATGLVKPLYRFELIEMLGGEQALDSQKTYFLDVNPKIAYMWWYPRYINFAVEAGIVEKKDFFRPDDTLTRSEFNALIGRTLEYLKNHEKTQS